MIYDKIKSEKGLKMHIKVFSWSLNGYLSLFLAHLGDTDPFWGPPRPPFRIILHPTMSLLLLN